MIDEDEEPLPKFIGNATMEQDGTLVLQLFAREKVNGRVIRGHASFRYPPDSPKYQETLEHVGPIKPGQKVGVRPWPSS